MTRDTDNDSGFRWGPFNLQGTEPWRLLTEQRGGSVIYPYKSTSTQKHSQHITDIDQRLPVIHKGNHFTKFTHPRDYDRTCDWFWWDNCLLPQIMDLTDDKQWTRIVFRGCFPDEITITDRELTEHIYTIESRIGHSLETVVPQHTARSDGRRVLYLEPNPNPLWHYYGVSQAELRRGIEIECLRQGLELVVRSKPSRPQRRQDPLRELLRQKWHSVITVHSAATAEVVASGLPCVQLGQGAYPRETMSWPQFCAGVLFVSTESQRQQRTRELAISVWHKQQLLEGTWQPQIVRQSQPQTLWNLYD